MEHANILILGGTGFVGQHVVDRLAAAGARVRVPTRRRSRARDLLVLPTVEVVEADPLAPGALPALLAGCDAVVNLIGVLHGSKRTFTRAHAQLPRQLVQACQAAGVRRLVHMSSLGADPNGPSEYLRSKGEGERAVLAASGLDVTVLRPSVVFGDRDSFLNMFAALAAVLPVIVVGGAGARLQPVWVQDLAGVVATVMDRPATYGRRYDICGPAVYTLRDLVRLAARLSGHPRPVLSLPPPLASLMALCFELLPGPTLLSRDNLRSLTVDSIAPEQPYRPAPELDLHPAALEPEAALYLAGLHPRTRFSGFRARARR